MIKTYNIAGINFNIDASGHSARMAEKYLVDFDENAVLLQFSKEGAQRFIKDHPAADIQDWNYFFESGKFSATILDYDGFVFHASAIEYEGNAYLFSANSGVGKSTHTSLWKKVFKDVTFINDDKPALRLIDGKFYAFGTPWSGKSTLNSNVKVPLKAICFIERGDKNVIERIPPQQAIPLILQQTMRKAGPVKTARLLELIDVLLKTTPIYVLKCLPNEEAAIVAYNELSKT